MRYRLQHANTPRLITGKLTHLPNCGCYDCNPEKLWWERLAEAANDALSALDEHRRDRALDLLPRVEQCHREIERLGLGDEKEGK